MPRDRLYSIPRALNFESNDEAPDKKDPATSEPENLSLIKRFNGAF